MTMPPLRRRGAALAAVIVSVALVLAGCGSNDSNNAAGATRSFKADNGTVQIPADPRRVATISNATLPFIDVGGEPIGVTALPASDLEQLPKAQQATFKKATDVGASGGEVDLEKLASLKPDLIIIYVPKTDFDRLSQKLNSIAPTVFYNVASDWKTVAAGIADASGKAAALTTQTAKFKKLVTKIQTDYSAVIKNDKFVAVDRYASNGPAEFAISSINCTEVAEADIGLDFPDRVGGKPYQFRSFEQLGELSKYNVILYPVDRAGQAIELFAPVVRSNIWKALPLVKSGHALGVYCPSNGSYGLVLQYLDSLDKALATLPAKG